MTYTDTDLLNALREFAAENGHPPTMTDVRECEEIPSTTAFVNHFGTWNAALATAGFAPNECRYSDADLLDALRAFAAENDGRVPTVPEANDRDGFPSATVFANHFGGWNAAVEAAGFDVRDRRRSDAELLADLRTFADETGERPTCAAVRARENMATPPTYAARFGSWSEALDAAGLPVFDS